MDIDTSGVVTDEQRDALKRLLAGNYTKAELEEILSQLPDRAANPSKEQNERVTQLESEGRILEAVEVAISNVFSLKTTEAIILGEIRGRLNRSDNLPDQMAELERIAQTEMGPRVADIERLLGDTFPLPTREIERLYRRLLTEQYELLEKEFKLEKTRRERKEALGHLDLSKPATRTSNELTEPEKLLAELCPSFEAATPQTQREVWSILRGFKRPQWALFFIETNSARKKYRSKTEAFESIVKPLAKKIEAISGLTNIRGVLINESSARYLKDIEKVGEVVSILRADAILRKKNLLPITET